jgi:hypothetical protein
MDNQFINRVKIYNPTNECFHSMFRYHKNYNKKLDFCKIMNQPPKLPNIGAWREKNWGCSSNGINQVLEADNTLFFETHDGYPLNVFKMLSVKHNTVQVSLLSWNESEYIAHNYLLHNGEIIKYNCITPDEHEHLYQQVIFLFSKCYYDKI